MKKLISIFMIIVMVVALITTNVNAADNSTKIELSDSKITIDGGDISTNNTEKVYLSTKMDNGGTSSDAEKADIEVSNIINITKAGTYEFTGTLSDGQISINANKIEGEIKIILNNAKITCKNAPAIFVYSDNVENEKCKVIIETAKNTENTITGAKIKTSVEGWEDQDSLSIFFD